MTSSSQDQAISVLNNHGVIAHQTDTVIGLACLPIETQLLRLTRIKQRELQKSFILLASSIQHLYKYIQVSDKELDTLNTETKQPTTWLVTANDHVPLQLIGETGKIAVRITNHVGIKSICDYVGAIASTSANIAGQPICSDIYHARAVFGPSIDYIDQNQTPGTAKSSTIIDLCSKTILRR
ncbi:MAG: L-threonylcarbamoyladenylate synthase [Gammaproteobacteria bacterium]|nr:L-threonylcarbamoyladenylate synthase [Gammaproteobacteria bacterium]